MTRATTQLRTGIESVRTIDYSGAMTFSASLFRSALALMVGLALGGCLPSTQSQLDEEKEPHFLAGKSRVNTMDYKGAIESFERAVEVNPQSASAHFELGWLYDQKEPDPAAAIYHYECYLKLLPNAPNGETVVKPRILACKQELARTVSLGPVTQTLEREFERLTEENKRLTEDNKKLHDETDKWRAYYASRQQLQTNQPGPALVSPPPRTISAATPVQPLQPGVIPTNPLPQARQATALPGSARTHAIKPGETLNMIAHQYGIRIETLLAANPRLNPRRLRVGETVSIPSQ
jgi:tetratricopeptide (TPR) repeat protein